MSRCGLTAECVARLERLEVDGGGRSNPCGESDRSPPTSWPSPVMPMSLCGVVASFSSKSNDCVSYRFIAVLIFRSVGSVGAPAPDAAAAVTAVVMADVLALRRGWMDSSEGQLFKAMGTDLTEVIQRNCCRLDSKAIRMNWFSVC